MRRIVLLLIVILIQSSYAAKKSCGTKKACKKFGREFLGMGRCQLKSEDCEGQIAEGRKYCKNTNRCHCCASSSDCKTQKACKMLGGKCQPNKAPCDGMVLSGEDYMNHCKDIYNCACCVPSTAPKPSNVDCEHWSYPSTDWPYTCNNFCNGSKQSPIDICTGSTTSYAAYIVFSWNYFDDIPKITIKNNGHTVSASWDSSLPTRTISHGGLISVYNLAQFHFHWGCKNDRGSEHAFDGTRYAMEVHFVHYKASYGNLKEAMKYADGLAVIALLFSVGGIDNDALKLITDNLQDIVEPGSEKEIEFNIYDHLLPFKYIMSKKFYRYEGSLTTPTCNEVVTWSVFDETIQISEQQMQAFRKLMDKENNMLCDNYRGIQPLNGRMVKEYN